MAAGIVLVAGWFAGSEDASNVARFGLGMVLITLGALVIGVPITTWVVRKTTRPEDGFDRWGRGLPRTFKRSIQTQSCTWNRTEPFLMVSWLGDPAGP